MQNLDFTGQMFESQVVHDLRALSGRQIFHARDASGIEVDAVFEMAGKTVLVEIKLGQSPQVLDKAAQNLRTFADRFAWDTPPLLLIVTGGNLSVQLPSGVFVTSLAHLAP